MMFESFSFISFYVVLLPWLYPSLSHTPLSLRSTTFKVFWFTVVTCTGDITVRSFAPRKVASGSSLTMTVSSNVILVKRWTRISELILKVLIPNLFSFSVVFQKSFSCSSSCLQADKTKEAPKPVSRFSKKFTNAYMLVYVRESEIAKVRIFRINCFFR